MQYVFENFGSTYGEQIVLQRFCEDIGGHYMLGSVDSTVFCRIELPCYASVNGGGEMHSPGIREEGSYFNKYELLLARLHYCAYS